MSVYVKLEDGSKGPLLATDYIRIVHGGRGDYMEIDPKQLVKEEVEKEPGQEYRFFEPWKSTVFYLWYRTKLGHRKVYYQLKTVNYADYKIGLVYISPNDVVYNPNK